MIARVKLADGSIVNSIGRTNAHVDFGNNLIFEIKFQVLEYKNDCFLYMPFLMGFNPKVD